MSENNTNNGGSGGSGSSNQMNAPVALSVPSNLKTLIRMIMRAFYSFECYLCMEMLMIYPCMKAEDLSELLRIDNKLVNQYLASLSKEKFLNMRTIMETTPDGRPSRHSYFNINYKMVVNVIKYKLDKIRIRIESEEQQSTTRANFKCTECKKAYSDLDMKDIFLTMRCLYCNSEIVEDTSSLPTHTSRNLLANFNTQMDIIFELLSQVEHVLLAESILKPEPVDMTLVLERMNVNQSNANAYNAATNMGSGRNGAQSNGSRSITSKFDSSGNLLKWSGDKTRNTDLLGQTKIQINIDDQDARNSKSARQHKELPSILLLNQNSDETNYDHLNAYSNRDSFLLNSVKQAADETLNNNKLNAAVVAAAAAAAAASESKQASLISSAESLTLNPSISISSSNSTSTDSSNTSSSSNLETIIMQKLLIHEKKSTSTSFTSSSTLTSTSAATPSPPTSNLNEDHQQQQQQLKRSSDSLSHLVSSASNGSSSIVIHKTTKRDFDSMSTELSSSNTNSRSINSMNQTNGFVKEKHEFGGAVGGVNGMKKRKLNNGDIVSEKDKSNINGFKTSTNGYHKSSQAVAANTPNTNNGRNLNKYHQKSYSDGSDREDESQFNDYDDDNNNNNDYDNSLFSHEQDTNDGCSRSSHSNNGLVDEIDEHLIPRVTVQNKDIRLDKLNPKLINLMSSDEKEFYINICRQLYTEIYEI